MIRAVVIDIKGKTMDRLMEQLDCEYSDIYKTEMKDQLLVSGG